MCCEKECVCVSVCLTACDLRAMRRPRRDLGYCTTERENREEFRRSQLTSVYAA